MIEGDSGEHLADDAQQRDAAVVVAITAVTFVLIEIDDVGISHVLGNVALLPACSGCRRVDFPCLRTSGGIPSFPGALPQARESMASLSSSSVGRSLSSSMTESLGRASRAASVTIFCVA